jgi:hypothetical protein
MATKTRADLDRRIFTYGLQSYLSPLTPEDKLIEIDFLINNTIKDARDDISTQIRNLKKDLNSKNSSYSKGGYKKTIRTRKNIKKNNKSNKNC